MNVNVEVANGNSSCLNVRVDGRHLTSLSKSRLDPGQLGDTVARLQEIIQAAVNCAGEATHPDCEDDCSCFERGKQHQIDDHCTADDCPGYEEGLREGRDTHDENCDGDGCDCYERGYESGDEHGHENHYDNCEEDRFSCGCVQAGWAQHIRHLAEEAEKEVPETVKLTINPDGWAA